MQMLAALKPVAACVVSYEQLTEDRTATHAALRSLLPSLGSVSADADVSVKDYRPQALRNMNEEQISTLAPRHRHLIEEGLAPYAPAVEALGY